jgi:hypothetical protein
MVSILDTEEQIWVILHSVREVIPSQIMKVYGGVQVKLYEL